MSEQIYTIKKSSLDELANKVRATTGISEWDKQLSLNEINSLLKDIEDNRISYVDLLKTGSGTLYVPHELNNLSSGWLSPFPNVTKIKWDKFAKDITIGSSAFSGSKLIEIELPKEIIDLGSYVFYNSKQLKKVYWNCSNIKEIPYRLFDDAASLQEVIFSKECQQQITSIREGAFRLSGSSGSTNLRLNFNSLINLQSMETQAFGGAGLTLVDDEGNIEDKLILPPKLTSLPYMSFTYARFKEVFFPKTFSSFSSSGNEFSSAKVEKIEFEQGIGDIHIASATFLRCPLTEIINSNCIKSADSSAFYSCDLLVTNEFQNLERIGYQCFSGVETNKLSLPKLREYAKIAGNGGPFATSKIETLTIGKDLGKQISNDKDYYNEFTSQLFKGSKINTMKFNGTLEEWCERIITSTGSDWPFLKEKKNEAGEIVYDQLYVLNSSGELVEPKGTLGSNVSTDNPYILDVETINSNVFYGYKNFGSFQFSNKLKNIKADAFKNSRLNTKVDRIRFDMCLYEYLQLNFENEYSSIFSSTTEGASGETIRIGYKNPGGTNYLNIAAINDTSNLYVPSDSGKQYMNPIIFGKNSLANIPFVNLSLGSTSAYPNKDLVIEFKDKVFYQSSEKLIINAEGEVVKRGVNACSFYYAKNIIVGNQSFYNNNKITCLQAAETGCNISSIGEEAFYGCTSLKSTQSMGSNTFILPIVKTIGNKAFQGCTALSSVTLGSVSNPVESVGEEAFVGCTGITEFTLYTNDQNIIAANTIPDSWGIDLEKENLNITIISTTSQEG